MEQRQGEGFHDSSYLESPLMDKMVNCSFLHYSTVFQRMDGDISVELMWPLQFCVDLCFKAGFSLSLAAPLSSF